MRYEFCTFLLVCLSIGPYCSYCVDHVSSSEKSSTKSLSNSTKIITEHGNATRASNDTNHISSTLKPLTDSKTNMSLPVSERPAVNVTRNVSISPAQKPNSTVSSTAANTSPKHWMEGGSVSASPANSSQIEPKVIPLLVPSNEPHKTISARKGAPTEKPEPAGGLSKHVDALVPLPNQLHHEGATNTSASTTTTTTTSTTTTTTRPTRRLKPSFTMVKGDKYTKTSESFIESSTTGKDYVLPIVLSIFALPAFFFLVKFLYKRGTEFTERQQYHRMYLIDGTRLIPRQRCKG